MALWLLALLVIWSATIFLPESTATVNPGLGVDAAENVNSSQLQLWYGIRKPAAIQQLTLSLPSRMSSVRRRYSLHRLEAYDNFLSAFAVDATSKPLVVYYCDRIAIFSLTSDEVGSQTLLERQATDGSCMGLALDTVGKMLYWTDGYAFVIRRISLTKTAKSSDVFATTQSMPSAIFVDSSSALIFWATSQPWNDWQGGQIERSLTDRSQRTVIIKTASSSILCITGDTILKQIYWADHISSIIEGADYDGHRRRVIAERPLMGISGISFVDGKIYWSEYRNHTIYALAAERLDEDPVTVFQCDDCQIWGLAADREYPE